MALDEIDEASFLEALTAGVRRTTDLIARITEYHGDAVRTEYMITADLAREFMERGHEVKVECLNRKLVNGMVALKSARPFKVLKSMRTDVAILRDSLIPLAMVEVKIGVKTLRPLKADLKKITDTIAMMQAKYAAKVIGAAVFQVHIPGSRSRYYAEQFKAAAEKAEKGIETELTTYAAGYPEFRFTMHALQGANDGFVGRDLEPDGDSFAWGQHGHATRYHAILIRSPRPVPPPPKTIEDLKKVDDL